MADSFEDLERILEIQEGPLDKKTRETILKLVNCANDINPKTIEKLLKKCLQNPKDDIEFATETLNIVSVVLKKVEAVECNMKPDLVPSILDLLFMINNSIYSCKSDKIKIMYFKLLIAYPDEVYSNLEADNKILEVLNIYGHQRIPVELKVQAFHVLEKYLKLLTPERKLKFVNKGINNWFLKLIPSVMSFVKIPDFDNEIPLAALELVANDLLQVDYYDNPNFQSFLQCFYEPKNYPTIMKNLLTKGSNVWHRIWIVFIKILKNYLTKSGSSGSPINSMLPVVEMAFKLDVTNRCRAFLCWNALIDNFATESNEVYIHKRMKLLVIPLYSNNAKVEETVIAKINTWWHLICRYYSKLGNFAEVILIPFLYYCFGKPNDLNKPQIPGMLTNKSKELCVEALVNILGHHNCDGCVSLPVVKERIFNDKCLQASRKDLVYSIKAAIKIVPNNASKLRLPYKCAWMSFLKLICDITNESLQRNLLNDLMEMLGSLIQNIQDELFADIVLNDLIFTLLKEDEIITLLNLTEKQENPILLMLLNPSFDRAYNKNDMQKAVENFKPFADFVVKHCLEVSTIDSFLNRPLSNYKSIVLWTAMTTSICEKKHEFRKETLCAMLYWPLKHLDSFCNVEFSTSMWFKLFEFVHDKLDKSCINDEIIKELNDHKSNKTKTTLFLLNVGIILLSNKISAGKQYEKEVSLIYNISTKFHSLNHTQPVFSKLLDVLLELFNNLLKDINQEIAKQVLMIFKLVFTVSQSAFQKPTEGNAVFLTRVEQLLKSVQEVLKVEAYAALNQIVLSEFLDFAQCLGQQKTLRIIVTDILQTFLKKLDKNDPSVSIIKNIVNDLNKDPSHKIQIDKPEFTTPIVKKGRKKDTSIVNTVVEDGEEFVVVKSNWKFNPKKLTENQKEKLKRKREDIPALYQDLSQSQDDFKLTTWKTDSQDTTTTNTNSKSNETTSEKVSSILKNIPNTDVVPKILKNILTENNEKDNSSLELTNDRINDAQTPVIKGVRPKLSLKDRIFRNVKLLTEKCDGESNEKHLKSLTDDVIPQMKTPAEMRIKISDANSAPSEINIERPSRLKRKPKKFDEMEVFALKKRCHSLCNSETRNQDSLEDSNNSNVIIENYKDADIKSSTSDTDVSKTHESDLTLSALNVAKDVIELKDAQNKHNLNIDHEQTAQDETADNEQQSKTNVLLTELEINIKNKITSDNSILVMVDTIQTKNDQNVSKEDNSNQNISSKKNGKKKSRIEKELAIDMVEGHPFLKAQSEKRLTRNKAADFATISRRKSLTQKLNKSKTDQKSTPKVDKRNKETDNKSKEIDTSADSQISTVLDENGSQDIIESSQDSTVSIMSVKSCKTPKLVPIITLENIGQKSRKETNNQSIIADSKTMNDSVSCNNDDTEFSVNKTAAELVQIDLTENSDAEPIQKISNNKIVTITSIDEDSPVDKNNLDGTYIEMDTQDIADADTQPMDSNTITTKEFENITATDETKSLDTSELQHEVFSLPNIDTSAIRTQEETTISLTETLPCEEESKQNESLLKLSPRDEEKRKQDFLNSTSEISPIKTLSPVREQKSPSLETSSDYVVIQLSSPVQCNGEPFEKCDSPEIFTEEKVSPDKRDQSPPREETRLKTVSPRSLSLKKNKPQVRPTGRAAQMLGLCIPDPDRIQNIMNSEKSVETEEPKKSSPIQPINSSARRNLRILYNSTNESCELSEENEESNEFLMMKRSLPAADSSLSVPILKRKLADIVDDSTVSPANKRKRVSFHDPPVSTTVCVKKYIESATVRSPQNSATKRQERLTRRAKLEAGGNFKSQKRLDTVFKLDTALTKAVESFSEGDTPSNSTEDTEMSSLEPTPFVEVVKNSDLNDVDPICLELINCTDPIDNIAGDLSSTSMRPLLVKEFAGTIETVGDLAKLTEVEVNRLCIKAPKVQTAKNVLTEYANNIKTIANEITPITEAAFSESTVVEKVIDVEMQTDNVAVGSMKVQTVELETSLASTQTDKVSTVECDIQTDELGSKSTEDIVRCLLEKSDYCDPLHKLLDEPTKQNIATSLPLSVLTDTFVLKMKNSNYTTNDIIDKMLEKHTEFDGASDNVNPRLAFLSNYLSERFNSKDVILFCSNLLKKVHDSNF